ncbi:MAG: TetR/AcrR family transcriptional regulator [Desulfosarcinaceae bacterium]|nr:TetR/AcrR family transcriptional regulator [Desulfosarcinaceae bacterium]
MKRIVKKPAERRKEIIKAARELFQEKDYDSVTMQGVMEKLNIAKGTIYHYFPSKEDLLEAVVEDLIDEELTKKWRLLKSQRCRELGALAKFRLLVTADTMAEENEQILDSLHHPKNTLMHTRLLGHYLIKLAPIFATVIEEGCDQGVFRTDHPRECAEFMLAGFQFLTDVGFYPWSQRQLERRFNAFPALIEAQLGAPKGSFSFLVEKK